MNRRVMSLVAKQVGIKFPKVAWIRTLPLPPPLVGPTGTGGSATPAQGSMPRRDDLHRDIFANLSARIIDGDNVLRKDDEVTSPWRPFKIYMTLCLSSWSWARHIFRAALQGLFDIQRRIDVSHDGMHHP